MIALYLRRPFVSARAPVLYSDGAPGKSWARVTPAKAEKDERRREEERREDNELFALRRRSPESSNARCYSAFLSPSSVYSPLLFAARVLFIQLRGPTLRALSDGALLKV